LLLQDRLLQPATIHFLFPEFLHGIIHGKLLAHLHRIYVWMYIYRRRGMRCPCSSSVFRELAAQEHMSNSRNGDCQNSLYFSHGRQL
jgi:hypothetical protein